MRSSTLCTVICGLLCAPTLEAQQNPDRADLLQEGFYTGITGGWTIPTGDVSGITDLIVIDPSVPASDIYEQGIAIGLFGGLRSHGWLVGGDIDMRLSPLTDLGQGIANLVGPLEERDVGVEYWTFELFGGKSLTVGNSETSRVAVFGGVGLGAVLLQLSQGTGVEPENDEGLAASVKAGMDFLVSRSIPLFIRVAARYQLLTAGVDVPRDVILQLGAGAVFGKG